MRVAVLISDDATFAPKILKTLLDRRGDDISAIVTVPATSTHKNFFQFVSIFLVMLGPVLFTWRVIQTAVNRLRARFGSLTSVSAVSKKFGKPLLKARRLNDAAVMRWLNKFKPEVAVTIQPQIIKPALLSFFPRGIINAHPGKLPAYRGPAPIFWALHNGEKEIAVTAHMMNERLDDGEIIVQIPITVEKNDNYYTLSEKVTKTIPDVFLEAFTFVEKNKPLKPNIYFQGCYQSYPKMKDVLRCRLREFARAFSWNTKINP